MTYNVTGMDLVSTSSTGSAGNAHSMLPRFSADGTKVVFSSATTAASWGGSGNTIAYDVFVKDLVTGTLTPISLNASGNFGNVNSLNASFSPDGSKIIFESFATNLLGNGVGTDTNSTSDIFVYTFATGAITRVSTTSAGAQATGYSTEPSFTPDSAHAIFTTMDPLAGAGDTGGFSDIYQKDLVSGAVVRLSTTDTGAQVNGNSFSGSVSNDGSKLGFISTGTNVTGSADANGNVADLFVKNLSTGAVTVANTSASGIRGNGEVTDYAFSADGTKVVFTSTADNLVSGDTNNSSDLFVKDLATGTIQLISKSTTGVLGNSASSFGSFSADGTKVIFQSTASNLVSGDTNFTSDIFIKDLNTGEISRVSKTTSGVQGDNISGRAVFSPVDNHKITFESAASNLVAADANGSIYDVFVATINNPPAAVNDSIEVTEGVPTSNLTPTLLANDRDGDSGDTKTIVSVNTSSTSGTVTFNAATQSLVYYANPAAFGLREGFTTGDIFTYTMVDSKGATSTATVFVNVYGVDNEPQATADTFAINVGDNTGNIYTAVLSNDSDPEGDTFAITSINTSSTLGTVTFDQATHTLVYTAAPGAFPGLTIGETANDIFSYTVTDSSGETATTTVTVTVSGTEVPNSAPDAVNDSVSVLENANTGNLAATLLGNDTDADAGDSLTITAVNSSGLMYGTIQFDQATQTVVYDAIFADALAAGETATDTFSYTIKDPDGATDTASVTVTLTGINDAPVAADDSVGLASGAATANIATLVLSNDTDVDHGDTKALSAINTTGTVGTVNFDAATQTLSYAATGFESLADGQTATDSFTYTVIDSHGATSTATVTVTVTGSNDGPVAAMDVVNVNEDATTANIIPLLLSNDSDADSGDSITVTSVDGSGLALGTLTFDDATQSLVYNANNVDRLAAGETATDAFSYTITDNDGETSTATVSVIVTGTNDGPDANNDAANVNLGAATANIASLLLANDTDVDNGDTRTITGIDTTGTLGTVTFDQTTQSLTYAADPSAFPGLAQGASTTDTFTYTITDSQGATSTATVTMTVTRPEVNDTPIANDDAVSVNEDAATGNLAAILLANDSDPDAGDTKTITAVDGSGLTLGTVAFDAATQSVVYSANQNAADSLAAGQTATETFSYTVTDGAGETDTASVTVTVTGVNDAPVAGNDASSIDNGSSTANLTGALLANDTDIDTGDNRTITSVDTTGTLGTVTFDEATQSLVYTANPAAFPGLGVGQTATDTFTYTITDSQGATSTATVTMTVNGVNFNDAPVAGNDALSVNEDAATGNLAATLLANDSDADGDTLHIASVNSTGLSLGTLAFDEATQSLVYNANNANSLAVGQTATDTFTYTVEDPSGETSTSTVNITVNGVNDAPVAANDGAAVASGANTGNLATTLLSNDTDVDNGDVLTISAVDTTGTLGTVDFNAIAQSVSYTASGAAFAALGSGQTATDTFTYTADDGHGGTSTATVTVTVTGANDGPDANDDAISVNEDAATGNLATLLLGNDTDPDTGDSLHISAVDSTGLTLGTVAFDEATQSVVYSANQNAADSLAAGQTATESFTYTVEDASGATSTATATVTVTGVNDAPVATNDASSVDVGVTTSNLASLLLSNDTDVDNGDTRTISGIDTTGTLGTVTFDAATQTLTYQANPSAFPGLGAGDSATDTFTYTITDSQGATSTATVTMTVNGVNDAPVAANDTVTVNEDASTGNLASLLLGNDTDADGDVLHISSVDSSSLAYGSVTFDEATQSVIYSADNANALSAGVTATDSFTYTVEDASGELSTATVDVTITGVNDAPVANDDASNVNAGGTTANLVSLLLGNDTDVDSNDTLTISSVDTAGTLGTVNFDTATQTLTYAAGAAFASLGAGQTATDTFSYTANDGHGGTSTATVTMTITGTNDGPVAVSDAVSVNEDATTANLAATLLANDTDTDAGDTKTITAVDGSGLVYGTVNFNAGTQTLTYAADKAAADTLGAGQTATDSFTYTMKDAAGATSSATVTVTVTGINDDPAAVADGIAVNAGGTTANLTATLLGNDTDVDTGDTKAIASVNTGGTLGTVNFDAATQTLTYAAGAAFASLGAGQTVTDTFTYTMRDAAGATSTATVTATITGVNDGPTAVNDAASVNEDATTANLVPVLLANDTDPDVGDTKTITAVDGSGLVYGTVNFDEATQALTYAADKALADTLSAGQTATDTFTYTMTDASGTASTATVTMTITGINDAPVAANDTIALNAGATTADISAALLTNDTDVDNGDTKTIVSVDTTGTNGTVAFDAAAQSLTYTAGAFYTSLGAGQTATDTFTYTMKDAAGATSTATVTATITGVNDGPTAVNDTANVNEDAATANLASTLLANDTDPDAGDTKTITGVDASGLVYGTVNFNAGTQTLTYAADKAAADTLGAGQTATDTFTYTMKDAAGATSTATVTMTITGVNDAPIAVNDTFSVNAGAATGNISAALLGNDTDVDNGDTKAIASVNTTGTLGTVDFNESAQTLTYAANNAAFTSLGAGQTVTDSFTYTMRDAAGATSTATVTATITGVNDGPTAVNDVVSVNEDAATANLVGTLLANDTDPDAGDTKSIVSVNAAGTTYGTVSFNAATQSLTYAADKALTDTLGAGQTATDTFTYTMKDGAGATSNATVTMTITGINDAPVAANDAIALTAGATTSNIAAILLSNDTDVDTGDTKAIVSVDTTGTKGVVAFNAATQSLTYTAGASYASLGAGQTATDTFTYTMKDAAGATSTATVTATITGVNDGPTAVNDAVSVNEDAATANLVSTLLANDTDLDAGDTKSIVSVAAAGTTYGTVSFNAANQSLTYAADKAAADSLKAGQTATDSFTYTMKDAAGATSTATVTMTVTGANDTPTAVNDAISVASGATTANLTATLLANDTDLDAGDTKAIASVNTIGTKGVVTFDAATQSLTYKAQSGSNTGQAATDTFTYTMRDAAGATSTATVTVAITGTTNRAPTAVNDNVSVNENATTANLVPTLLANDTDPDTGDTKSVLSVNAAGTVYGTVSFNAATQSLTYAADKAAADGLKAGQTATDTFTYTMKDTAGLTSTATVAVKVTGINDAPVAAADTVSVSATGTSGNLTGTLLGNDTDLDIGDTKAITLVNTAGTKGAVAFNASQQSLTYTAGDFYKSLGAGQTANDTFTYTMKDAAGATSTAVVTVKVTGVNDGPTAVKDAVSVNEDATTANLVSTLLANDTDPDAGDTKRISTVTAGGLVYGTVTFNEATQTLTYAADKAAADALRVGQTATDTFTYTMKDAAGATSTATVTMTVNGVNDAPLAADDALNADSGNPLTISIASLLANDKDVDGTISFNGVTVNPGHGTITLNNNGTLTYKPATGYTGTDSFTYSVKDNNGATDTAIVTLDVKAIGKLIKGTAQNDTLRGGAGNDTIEGGADKGSVTAVSQSYFLGTKTTEQLVGNDTDSNASTIGWQKAWGQYTPVFQITAVGVGETEATGYKFSSAVPSFSTTNGNAHTIGIGVDGKASKGGTIQQETGYDPITRTSEKMVFDAKGDLIAKAAFDLSAFFSKVNGADNLGGTKYSEVGHWEAYKNGVLVGQGDFVAGVADSNAADGATLAAIGSNNNESLLTLDFSSKGGFDKVVLSAKQYDGLNANQSAAAGKPLGTANANDSSDFLVRNVKFDMMEKTFNVTIGDHLYGGGGNDTFIFNKGSGVDAIHDFTAGDIIKTNYKAADVVTGWGTDTLIFKNGAAFEAVVAEDNGHLWGQSDFLFG